MTKRIFLMLALLPSSLLHSDRLEDNADALMPLNNFGASARATSLGSGFVGIAEGSETVLFNPAGLGSMEASAFAVHHNSWLVDISQESLTLAMPSRNLGVLGFSADYLNLGKFENRNSLGAVIGESQAFAWGGSVAWGRAWSRELDIGARLRVDGQSLDGDSVFSAAADLGLLWQVPIYGLRLGAVAASLGSGFEDAAQVAQFRLGLSRPVVFGRGWSLTPALGFNIENFGTHRINLAAELVAIARLSMRAGYTIQLQDNRLEGWSGAVLGLGVKVAGMQLDWAVLPMGLLGTSHRVSLGWTFEPRASRIAVQAPELVLLPEPLQVGEGVKTGEVDEKPGLEPAPEESALSSSSVAVATAVLTRQAFVVPQKVEANGPSDPLDVYFKVKGGEKVSIEDEDDLMAVTKDAPMSTEAWKTLGRFYYVTRQWDKVARCLRRVIETDPSDQRARDWLEKYEELKK